MRNEIRLDEMHPGEIGRVRELRLGGDLRRRLQDIGLIEGTLVECIGKSPSGDPNAYLIKDITYQEAIDRDLRVMDPSAFQLCKEQKLPQIRVFNMDNLDNILRVAQGETIGTVVHG